jgi:hypothetical protein
MTRKKEFSPAIEILLLSVSSFIERIGLGHVFKNKAYFNLTE